MPVKHKKVYSGGGAKVFADPDWNDPHIIDAPPTNISGTYAILDADEFIRMTAGSGSSWTITLPDAALRSGRVIELVRIDAGSAIITLATTSSQTINGSTTYQFSNQWQNLRIRSDGVNWIIVA